MSWQITQCTPHGDSIQKTPFMTMVDAKVFAEEFMVNEEDSMTDVNRMWIWSDTSRHWCMDVHADYSIIIKEVK